MAAIIIYFSRADENYFGGQYRYIEVGNTEVIAKMVTYSQVIAILKFILAIHWGLIFTAWMI